MHPRTRRLAFVYALALLLQSVPLHAAETVRVQRALDGDSLLLADGRRVRLIGINAPELGRDGAPDEPLAAAARDRTMALVRNQAIRLVDDVERHDRHGRTLAYADLTDGRDLQELLIREGLSWFVAVAPNTARLDRYRVAEAEARRAGRGIWGRADYAPVPAEALAPGRTGFLRVSGTVSSGRRRGDAVELHLTAQVRLLILGAHGFPRMARSLVGKRVVARGWLTEYKNGLRMRITHPAMLEVAP